METKIFINELIKRLSKTLMECKNKKMKATYNITLKLTIVHDVDKIDESLKSETEMANDIVQMIADESALAGAVVCYELLEGTLTVK